MENDPDTSKSKEMTGTSEESGAEPPKRTVEKVAHNEIRIPRMQISSRTKEQESGANSSEQNAAQDGSSSVTKDLSGPEGADRNLGASGGDSQAAATASSTSGDIKGAPSGIDNFSGVVVTTSRPGTALPGGNIMGPVIGGVFGGDSGNAGGGSGSGTAPAGVLPSQIPLVQLPVIRPTGQFSVIQGANRFISPASYVPTASGAGQVSGSPPILPPGSLVMSGNPGSMQMMSGSPGSVQLPVVMAGTSPIPQSQGMPLPMMMAAGGSPVSSPMLIPITQPLLQFQQMTAPHSSGLPGSPLQSSQGNPSLSPVAPGRVVRLAAPLQILPTNSTKGEPVGPLGSLGAYTMAGSVGPQATCLLAGGAKGPGDQFLLPAGTSLQPGGLQPGILARQQAGPGGSPQPFQFIPANAGSGGSPAGGLFSPALPPKTANIILKTPSPSLISSSVITATSTASGPPATIPTSLNIPNVVSGIGHIVGPPGAAQFHQPPALGPGYVASPGVAAGMGRRAGSKQPPSIIRSSVVKANSNLTPGIGGGTAAFTPGAESLVQCKDVTGSIITPAGLTPMDTGGGGGMLASQLLDTDADAASDLANTNASRASQHKVSGVKGQDEAEDDTPMSLECTEEFDDSFEKNKAASLKVDSVGLELLQPLEGDDIVEDTDNLSGNRTNKKNVQQLPFEVKTNEFGLVELMPSERKSNQKNNSGNSAKSGQIPPSPRKDSIARRIQDDDILYCEGCGCYGMAGEFSARNSCSTACTAVIVARQRDKQRKEQALDNLNQRRNKGGTLLGGLGLGRGKKRGLSMEGLLNVGVGGQEDDLSAYRTSHFNSSYPWQHPTKGFIWSKYLEWCKSRPAPVRFFPAEAFPQEHGFEQGMKLEAIDPLHQALICVVSVAEVQGPRLRLHFDGYSDSYDFWENGDSENLFPAGWCEKNSQRLTPPKGYSDSNFSWSSYLSFTNTEAAPEHLFTGRTRAAVGSVAAVHGWKVGMKLEACDRQNKSLICVATVSNIIEGRILLHFDGWEIDYDYWTRPASPNVKPVGWAAANKKQLNPPKGNHPSSFSWPDYLSSIKAKAVPTWAFRSPGSSLEESEFQVDMKLESIDLRNPRLLRVATVASVQGRQLELRFDGWSEEYNQTVDDDSPDIHPCGWAAKTGHTLQPPLTPQEVKYWEERGGCPTPGCKGIGHIKGEKYSSHHTLASCPYSPQNVEHCSPLPDRLQGQEARVKMELQADQESREQLGRGNRKRKRRRFFDDQDGDELERSESRGSGRSLSPSDSFRSQNNDSPVGIVPLKRIKRSTSSGGYEVPPDKLSSEDVKVKKEPFSDLSNASTDGSYQGVPDCTTVGCQTTPPRIASPPFLSEWEEGVRKSVWQPGYLPQPEPPGFLPANWHEHSKILLAGREDSISAVKARLWTVDQVVDFFCNIPNVDHANLESAVRDQEIDGESMMLLTQNDLTKILGVKLGPAIKIYNAIMAVRMRRD